ncbi:MAG: flagellar hook-length control protein FliK [Candidatus Tectimicrobiota bacterium]
MITPLETFPFVSVSVADSASPKARNGDFDHLLSAVQDATSTSPDAIPEASAAEVSVALEHVLQTLADILQPLTFSLEAPAAPPGLTESPETLLANPGSLPNGSAAAFVPLLLRTSATETPRTPSTTLPRALESVQATTALLPQRLSLAPSPGDAAASSDLDAPGVDAEEAASTDLQEATDATSQEAAAGVQATLGALLAAQESLRPVVTTPAPGAASSAQSTETLPAGDVLPSLDSTARRQTRSLGLESTPPVTTAPARPLNAESPPQAEDAVPFAALLPAFAAPDTAAAPPPAAASTPSAAPTESTTPVDTRTDLQPSTPGVRPTDTVPTLVETTPAAPAVSGGKVALESAREPVEAVAAASPGVVPPLSAEAGLVTEPGRTPTHIAAPAPWPAAGESAAASLARQDAGHVPETEATAVAPDRRFAAAAQAGDSPDFNSPSTATTAPAATATPLPGAATAAQIALASPVRVSAPGAPVAPGSTPRARLALDNTLHSSIPLETAPLDSPPQGNTPSGTGDTTWAAATPQALAVPSPEFSEVPPLAPAPEQPGSVPESLSGLRPATDNRIPPEELPEAAPRAALSTVPATSEAPLFAVASPAESSVPEASDASLSSPPPPSDGLSVPPSWRLPRGAQTLLLHVHPPEFGPLLVHVRLQDKRLSASLQAESPEVEAILRANLPALQASLSQHGFDVQSIALSLTPDGFNTDFNSSAGGFSQQQSTFHAFTHEQPGPEGEARRSEPEPQRLFAEPRSYNRRLLDVLI